MKMTGFKKCAHLTEGSGHDFRGC